MSGNPRMETKPISPAPPLWAELPFEITANILHRLTTIEILETAQYVCKSWHSVCNDDPSMWRVIDIRGSSRQHDDVLDQMCRHAVDKGQGMLVDISLKYFASNELLVYIAERSKNLRRLRLAYCYNLSDKGLIKAIERLPSLEELHIEFTPLPSITVETVETIGYSCPLLRSFVMNKKLDYHRNLSNNKVAYAIARSMPELRRLQLRGNDLTNKGLKAILDGCPHLESLDLKR